MHVNSMRTKSRICLTGYPIQNNLEEYWTMVDFVNPNYLGSLSDFRNAFIHPIENGLYSDSTRIDKRIGWIRMKVLHELLLTVVLRRDAETLHKQLPRKVEIVISCPLTETQQLLYYNLLIAYFGKQGLLSNRNLLEKCHPILNICNHPAAFKEHLDRRQAHARQQEKHGQATTHPTTILNPSAPQIDSIIEEPEEIILPRILSMNCLTRE